MWSYESYHPLCSAEWLACKETMIAPPLIRSGIKSSGPGNTARQAALSLPEPSNSASPHAGCRRSILRERMGRIEAEMINTFWKRLAQSCSYNT